MYVLGYILYTYLYMSECIYEFIFVCMYCIVLYLSIYIALLTA